MSKATIHVYVSPQADISRYPDNLLGDMSVFKQARTIQHEVQWIFYLMLKDHGMDVRICHDFPESGILLIHRSHVKKFNWNPDVFVVSLQWDYKRDDRAQMHMVSNHFKTTSASLGWLDRLTCPGLQHYITPIMHPVIESRDPERGDRFENVAFIGDPKNMDKAFRTEAFRKAIDEMGMNFVIRSEPEKMSDFTDIDVVVAVRKIGQVIQNKPPVKLINAWRGGVPSILGREIGYQEARESEYDYIEVDSVDEALAALRKLKDDVEFRHKMLTNGKERSAPFSAEGQQNTWVGFFEDTVLPAYGTWAKKSKMGKSGFLALRRMRYLMRESMSYVWHRVLRRGFSDYS